MTPIWSFCDSHHHLTFTVIIVVITFITHTGSVIVSTAQVAEGFSEVIEIRTLPMNFKSAFEESMFFSYLEP